MSALVTGAKFIWNLGETAVKWVCKNPKNAAAVVKGGTKVGVATAAAGYVGWNWAFNDKTPGQQVGELLGKGVDEVAKVPGAAKENSEVIQAADEKITEVKDKLTGAVDDVKETSSQLSEMKDTVGNFLGGSSNLLGGLFNTIGLGKISGLGIGMLLAASYLIFGRTSLLAKAGGLLMGLLAFSGMSQGQSQSASQVQTQARTQEQTPGQEQQACLHR